MVLCAPWGHGRSSGLSCHLSDTGGHLLDPYFIGDLKNGDILTLSIPLH